MNLIIPCHWVRADSQSVAHSSKLFLVQIKTNMLKVIMKHLKKQVLHAMIKQSLGMSKLYFEVPRFEPRLCYQSQLPAIGHPGKQLVKVQVIEFLLSSRKT